MNGIVLTIGVNVYNVSKRFLIACLESVISQKGDDVEIIIVDDGSTDQSGKICDEYAAKDTRVCVIHQQNVGIGPARNVIIDNAQGKWITFVDGDDTLTPNAVEILRKYFNAQQDVIVFLEKHRCQGKELDLLQPQLITDITYYQTHIYDAFPMYHQITMWGKLFRTDFFRKNNLRVLDVRKSQDFLFTINYLFYTNSLLLVPKVIYDYRQNAGSVSNIYNPKIEYEIDKFIELLRTLIETHQTSNNSDFSIIYYREGLINIYNLLYLIPYHADCHWGRKRRLSFLNKMLHKQWIKTCIDHDDYLFEWNKIVQTFCRYGKMGDVASIDAYYIKQRQRRQYWKLCQTLRKVTIFSVIMDMLKAIKCKFQKN